MKLERLKHTFRLWFTLGSSKRMEYLKSHHVFRSVGEHSTYMDRKVPLYANLIRIGNNVHVASNVDFVTHDAIHAMLNKSPTAKQWLKENGLDQFEENVGCIEIKDNVFIGTRTIILGNVKVGSNVIIGAGSIVNKDIPDNSVAAGVPAKVVGSFEDFLKKKSNSNSLPNHLKPMNQIITKELEDYLWEQFLLDR